MFNVYHKGVQLFDESRELFIGSFFQTDLVYCTTNIVVAAGYFEFLKLYRFACTRVSSKDRRRACTAFTRSRVHSRIRTRTHTHIYIYGNTYIRKPRLKDVPDPPRPVSSRKLRFA